MKLIDGKLISQQIKEEIAVEVKKMVQAGKKRPHLAAILVGTDGGSLTYVGHKVKACEQVGFKSTLLHYEDPDSVSEEFILSKIKELNEDDDVDGFIVQLPLPDHIDENKVIEAIDYKKDVDGFHPINIGRMIQGMPAFISATPAGIMELIMRYNIKTSGKQCAILGRSNIVGRPLSILMSMKAETGNATVTLCHSCTPNIADFTRKADIIVAAMGKPGFLKGDMVKEGAVVIDVGTTRLKSDKTKSGWKLYGDVEFDTVAEKCSYITPVPGGVGPMTIVSLISNTLKAAKKEIFS